ncbi:MAG: hypothetical protein WBN08_07355, partial [Thiogranum sp.]
MLKKYLFKLTVAGLMGIGVATAADTTGPSSVASILWSGGEIDANNQLPSLTSYSLQLAQADSGDTGNGTSSGSPKEGQYTKAQINEMINNPLG